MSICQNCGEPILPQQTFCKNCGAKIEQTRSITKETKTAISVSLKWAVFAVVILAAGMFAVHTYLSNIYKPEKTIERFEIAVKQKDYQSLHRLLEQGGTDAALSDNAMKDYIAFLTKEKDLSSIVNDLQKNIGLLTEYGKITPVTDNSGNKLLVLVKGQKKFFLYQQYFIKAYPYTVTIHSNLEKTNVTFNGSSKMIKNTDDKITFRKVLPGGYSVKGVYQGDYASLDTKENVNFQNASNNNVDFELQMSGQYVTIYSNGDNADIYANGKKTGLKTSGGTTFGPVRTDGSIQLYAVLERDSGTIKSDTVKIDSTGEVELDFKEIADEGKRAAAKEEALDALATYSSSSDHKEQMYSFMDEFISRSVEAYNARDFSIISSYLTPDGNGYQDTEKYISTLEEKGITEDFLGLEVLDMQSTDTGFKVKIREEYNIYRLDSPSEDAVFESTYTIKAGEFGLQVVQLDSTNKVKSSTLN